MLKTLILTLALLGAGTAHAVQPSDTRTDETCDARAADTPTDHDCPCLHAESNDCEETMSAATIRTEPLTDFALTLRHNDGDHFSIEGEGYERIQWASFEGSGDDMLDIATAIEQRTSVQHKRVSLSWHESGDGIMCSPRNSLSLSRIAAPRLVALAPVIRRVVAEARANPSSETFGDFESA